MQALAELGHDYLALSEPEQARTALEQLSAQSGEALKFSASGMLGMAGLALAEQQGLDALRLSREFQDTASEFRNLVTEAQCLEGEALILLGRTDEAVRVLRAARAEAQAISVPPSAIRAGLALAEIFRREGDDASAERERAEAHAQLSHIAEALTDADLRQAFERSPLMRQATRPL